MAGAKRGSLRGGQQRRRRFWSEDLRRLGRQWRAWQRQGIVLLDRSMDVGQNYGLYPREVVGELVKELLAGVELIDPKRPASLEVLTSRRPIARTRRR